MLSRIRPGLAALALGSCLVRVGPAHAAEIDYAKARLDRRLPAVQAQGPIVIDGTLDEADWTRAPVAKGFIQSEPSEGEQAADDTEVRVLYDEENLYIGVFAHDREPDRIITNELSKDFNRTGGDTFEIVLDTFRDERNGYMFATNASGAKWDAQMVNEGREFNENWDGIWYVRTRVVEDGWYAEISIPFRMLRFGSLDAQTWGINFLRRIRRRYEDSLWSPLPRIYELSRVSLAGTLEGLQGIKPGNDLRFKPYVLGSVGARPGEDLDGDADAGLDVKYGVTSGLTWDFTVNTDFSQVEADEQQVNLTRFSLFFPEKRDFFLENSGVFQFGTGNDRLGAIPPGSLPPGSGQGARLNNQSQDSLLFFSRRIGLSEGGVLIPILGGTRLTGRVGRFSVGALNIQQRRVKPTPTSTFSSPSTNFTALRLRRDVFANSDIGVLVLNKDADGVHYNRVVGADSNFRFFNNLYITGYAAKSYSPQLIKPGEGKDALGKAGFQYRGDFWEFRGAYLTIGERFNDEMGFVPRVGINKWFGYVAPHVRSKFLSRWGIREWWPHIEVTNIERHSGGLDSRYIDYHIPFGTQNGGLFEFGRNVTVEHFETDFVISRRRNVSIPPGEYDFGEYYLLYRGNPSKPVSFTARYNNGDFYDGKKQTYGAGTAVRVGDRLNTTVTWVHNDIEVSGGDYTTNLITSRVEYSFSTFAFLSALVQYNTDAREWSSNMRFNVIHRPLSDFFLVYNERRDSSSNDLLDRALIAKMTYMVAF